MSLHAFPAQICAAIAITTLTACASRPAQQDWHGLMARPAPAFSQVPFWFWNDALEDGEIGRQLADFREHGVFGFVIHPRMGLPADLPYMGERWLHHVKTAVEEAARTGMRVCLYDEAMYPSGSAHGEVVRTNPDFAAKGLMVAYKDVSGPAEVDPPAHEGTPVARVMAGLIGENALDGDSVRVLDGRTGKTQVPSGRWRLMTFSCVPSEGRIRGVHEGEEPGQPHAPPAANLLDPEAMQCFIRLTHERYYAALKDHFGKTIFAMFTDEPNMLGRGPRKDLKPWTSGLERYFEVQRGYTLTPLLPALFFDIGDKTRAVRDDFAITLTRRLNETYYRPLSEWCERHSIALTGHPGQSDDIELLRFFQIPGQDVVWRQLTPGSASVLEGPHSTMAKCTSSVARHDDRKLNSNECLGAYGWDLTMDEMKWLADWLMVRGVNLLMPHAFYYSIRGERVHERPPDVGPNNAWWPYYRPFADYTARLCGLLAEGRQICTVAVLVTDNRPSWRAARRLFENQIDFNYLEDWRFIEQARVEDHHLCVAEMRYEVIIVDQDQPPADAVRRRLEEFRQSGGRVIQWPADPSVSLPAELPRDAVVSPPCLDLRCLHLCMDRVHFYLLINEGERSLRTMIRTGIAGKAEWFDPWEGVFRPAQVVEVRKKRMAVPVRLDRRQSLVLCVDTDQPATVEERPPRESQVSRRIPVTGSWQITDSTGKAIGTQLGDWQDLPEASSITGTLRYNATLQIDMRADSTYEINLGQVGDLAVLHVNGRSLGPRMWSPFVWDLGPVLRNGRNELTVEVTNSLTNRWATEKARVSGLLGPIEIREYRHSR